MNKKLIRALLFTLVFFCMATIFLLSQQNSQESGWVSQRVTQQALAESGHKTVNPSFFVLFHHMIRKFAHVFEYTVLGFLLYAAMKTVFRRNVFVYSLLAGLIYAATDEIHQLFIPGRSGRAFDVLVDGLGLLFGMLVFTACQKFYHSYRRKT